MQQHFCQVWAISHHPPCQLQPLSATKLNLTCFTLPLKATLSITSRRIFCCLFFDSIISFPMSSLCTHVPLRVCRHPICILEDFRVLDFLKLKRSFFPTIDGWDWLDLFWLLKLFQYDFRQTGNSIKCPTYPTDTNTATGNSKPICDDELALLICKEKTTTILIMIVSFTSLREICSFDNS